MLKTIWDSLFSVKRISASSVNKLLKDNKIDHWQIVDIRDELDWQQGHIPNSVNMPLPDWQLEHPYEKLNKVEKVLIVCTKGLKSESAESHLTQRGFKNVLIMKRGMQEWYFDLEK